MPPAPPWQRDDAGLARVKRPRILTPLFPQSLLMPAPMGVERRIVAPEDRSPWPEGAAWLEYQPKIAAVLGRETAGGDADEVRRRLRLHARERLARRGATARRVDRTTACRISLGPCVVTVDELDPQSMFVEVKRRRRDVVKGNLNGTAELVRAHQRVSQHAVLERGDAFALGPFPR